MWKDVLRRRWINAKYNPVFVIIKLAVIVGILALWKVSFFLCEGTIFF